MELTRRDALVALAVVGGAVGGRSAIAARTRRGAAGSVGTPAGSTPGAGLGPPELETMVAIARVVYPTPITGIDEFVVTYLDGRERDRPAHAAAIARVIDRLDRLAREWHGAPVSDLDRETTDRLLREVGADTAAADPAGTTAQRVRYYLVNELLFALYASPLGGDLVGLENPQGHPGGLESYRRGPRR